MKIFVESNHIELMKGADINDLIFGNAALSAWNYGLQLLKAGLTEAEISNRVQNYGEEETSLRKYTVKYDWADPVQETKKCKFSTMNNIGVKFEDGIEWDGYFLGNMVKSKNYNISRVNEYLIYFGSNFLNTNKKYGSYGHNPLYDVNVNHILDDFIYTYDLNVYNLHKENFKLYKYRNSAEFRCLLGETCNYQFKNINDNSESVKNNLAKFEKYNIVPFALTNDKKRFKVISKNYKLYGGTQYHVCDGGDEYAMEEYKFVENLYENRDGNMYKFNENGICGDNMYTRFVSCHPEERIVHRMLCTYKTNVYGNFFDRSAREEYRFQRSTLKDIFTLMKEVKDGFDNPSLRHEYICTELLDMPDLKKVNDLDYNHVEHIVVIGDEIEELNKYNTKNFFDIHYVSDLEELEYDDICKLYNDVNLVIIPTRDQTTHFEESSNYMTLYLKNEDIDYQFMKFLRESTIPPIHRRLKNLLIGCQYALHKSKPLIDVFEEPNLKFMNDVTYGKTANGMLKLFEDEYKKLIEFIRKNQ